MRFSFLSLALAAAVAPAVMAAPSDSSLAPRANPVFPVGTVTATWDGQCTYPKPVPNFEAAKYVGTVGGPKQTWYQLAAADQFFLAGCSCVRAQYGLNQDGSVAVTNTCKRFGIFTSDINGTAPPSPAKYGAGTFKVGFGFPTGSCPGPNYIVQKAWFNKPGEPENTTSGSRYETVIVSSDGFQGWFLLSRTQNVDQAIITEYLKSVAALGNDLKKPYSITSQTGC